MKDPIIGQKIVNARPMTKAEQEDEGWDGFTTVLVLSDGTLLYASRDEEGNGAGALFGKSSSGKSFAL